VITSHAISRAAALALFVGLGACVTIFPKAKPVQVYRFGAETALASNASANSTATFNVLRATTSFTLPAEGDRILTTDGRQVAYIADARWAAPAAVLFDEAETRAFEVAGGPARLINNGAVASGVLSLRLDVQSFEARYDGSLKSAPTIVVVVHGTLVRMSDRQVLGDRVFESRKPAGDNRLGAIVQAFDASTSDVLGQVVAWTNAQGAA
jgi:cholesterol transport system auxiliary component